MTMGSSISKFGSTLGEILEKLSLELFTVNTFGSFSHVWQKNDQNNLKNEMKNDMNNGYCEHPGKQK